MSGILETTLIWVIGTLAAADIFFLAVLVLHHSISGRRRVRRSEKKALWKEAFSRALTGAGPIPRLDGASREEMTVASEALREMIVDYDTDNAAAARELFETLGFPEFYLQRLSSRLWWRRADAVLALGESSQKQYLTDMVPLLEDRFLITRLRTAMALAYLGTPESVDYLLDHLEALGSVSMQWLKDIFYHMLKDHPGTVRQLLGRQLPLLVAKAVIETAAEIRGFKETDMLVLVAGDPGQNMELRISAVKSLGELKKGKGAIENILLDAEDWELRAAAARALGGIGDSGSLAALRMGLTDQAWWVRANSAAALGQMGPKALEVLRSALEDEDKFARDIATQTLADVALLGPEREKTSG